MNALIRTVLGDIDPQSMGVCYAHEHLIIDPSYTTERTPDFLIDNVNRCIAELRECYAAGVRAMVDSMPMACGRNVVKLVEVSRESRIHVLCPTGLHLRKYYPQGHWCDRLSAEQLGELFIREIIEGIDANDGNGPQWQATPHRAGLIKIASGLDRIDQHERKVFEAAAIAHRATGAPILTHCENGTAALEQVKLLQSLGVDIRHTILSHTDRAADIGYHRELLSTGVRVEYDRAFSVNNEKPSNVLNLLKALLADFPDQIMLGMDAARRSYWKNYDGSPGLTFLIKSFIPAMREIGLTDDLIDRVFVTTPADAYSIRQDLSPRWSKS